MMTEYAPAGITEEKTGVSYGTLKNISTIPQHGNEMST